MILFFYQASTIRIDSNFSMSRSRLSSGTKNMIRFLLAFKEHIIEGPGNDCSCLISVCQ